MKPDKPISMRQAARGVTVRCLRCHGVVSGATSECVARCGCETPRANESTQALEAMLSASRRGRTVGR